MVDAAGPREPLYETLCIDTFEPLAVSVPFHTWVMVWPLLSVHPTVQALIAELPAVTLTSPWKPPGQELTVR